MSHTALKLVQAPEFEVRELELWSSESSREAHSLHYVLSLPSSIRAEIPSFFIPRYSKRGDVVLDPFCGSGAVALEANLQGRVAFAADSDELALRVARAKVEPADITDVTLRLQQMNLRKPISVKSFEGVFSPFYDLDTFRELVNLRIFLQNNYDRTSRFIELIALSLLHGHVAGYFSVYSWPQFALSPQEQHEMNLRRSQVPDYRAVMPRILRRTASVLRDGTPSIMRQASAHNRLSRADARDLNSINSASVNLIISAPPTISGVNTAKGSWLRRWFCGLSLEGKDLAPNNDVQSLAEWRDFFNECLLEFARVTRKQGRAVFELPICKLENTSYDLAREALKLVSQNLNRYWEAETLIVNKPRQTALKEKLLDKDLSHSAESGGVVVLRRR